MLCLAKLGEGMRNSALGHTALLFGDVSKQLNYKSGI